MRILRGVMAVSLVGLACAAGAATPATGSDELVFVTATYRDRAQLQDIASRFQHLIVDERTRTVRVEATQDEIDALRRAGIRVTIDDTATTRMRESSRTASQPVTAASIPGYTCYRTVEETYATMDVLARSRPNLARVIDIGPTWVRSGNPDAGYRMRVLRLTNAATDYLSKPSMVVFASIHAREYTPAEVATRFGEWLVDGYGTNSEATWLLDNYTFHLVLQANPDGRKKAEAGLSWRKNVNTTNGVCSANAYGVDLNRNFPFRWASAAGGSSGNPCLGNYRGPAADSEPETDNLLRYVAGTRGSDGVFRGGVLPDRRTDATTSAAPSDYRGMFIDLHSYARMVLWPWSFSTTPTANAAPLQTLGRRLAWFNGYSPRQWSAMYLGDGTTTDTVYGLLGAPSYTLEMGVAFFESCSEFEGTTLPRNLAALRYAARSLHAPYVYPSGPDTTSISVSPTRVAAGTPIRVTATVDDTPFNQSRGTEPVQGVVAAQAFVNRWPWTSGATARTLYASDGSFGARTETVTGSIPTDGLAIGRHVVAVRGRDSSGRYGTLLPALFTIAGTRTFANETDVAVADRSAATSAIGVSGIQGTAPTALRINVDVRHPNIGDLVLDLIAPRGTVYRLHSRSGGTADNIIGPYTRNASTETANGTWRLRVTDQVTGITGYINRWSLQFAY